MITYETYSGEHHDNLGMRDSRLIPAGYFSQIEGLAIQSQGCDGAGQGVGMRDRHWGNCFGPIFVAVIIRMEAVGCGVSGSGDGTSMKCT
jgi:hypothetical protein